jgi:tetratricopeptide (TPR) repeat protein
MTRFFLRSIFIPALVGLGLRAWATPEAPDFRSDIAPVIWRHCAPCHHPGGAGPFSLVSYEDVRKRAREIADVTARRAMPPWLPAPQADEFREVRRLSDAELDLLQRWFRADAPEGSREPAPQPPAFSSDWQLGPPDLVIRMPAPFVVPPGGRDVYRHFVLPLSITNRRYVRAWELRSHAQAAHHAFVRFDRTGEGRRRDAEDPEPGFPGMDTPPGILAPNGHFSSWQPGAAPTRNPPGLAWTLEPGTDVVIQFHLQPGGKPEPLQAELGFYFTDEAPTNQPVKIGLVDYAFVVPAGATNAMARDEILLPVACDVLGVLPHTHYLGRRILARANLPDGSVRQLLSIPDWDFNWQGAYLYERPVNLPAGTRIGFEITFDNSAANPRNPFSPPQPARFGPNTTDEMAELWLQLLPRNRDRSALDRLVLQRTVRDTVGYNEQRLRIQPTDAVAHLNLGRVKVMQRQFDMARAYLERSLALDPKLAEARYQLGLLNRVQQRRAEAIKEFNACIAINPGHARAHGNLGLLNREQGQIDAAAHHFAEAVRIDPSDALAMGQLGMIRLAQGRLAEAEAGLSRALELNPDDAEVRQGLTAARLRRAENK